MKFTLEQIAQAWDEALKGRFINGPIGASFDSAAYTAFQKALVKLQGNKGKKSNEKSTKHRLGK